MSEENRLARLGLAHLADQPEALMKALEVMHRDLDAYEAETRAYLAEQIAAIRARKTPSRKD